MDWLRNNSFITSNRQQRALLRTEEECDPTACYDSFKEHWQQVLKIIERNQHLPSHDDVLSVVNHLEQMVSLLLYDIKAINQINLAISTTSQCSEYLLTENLLDKLYEWGIRTGKYINAVRLEQLKLYEMLVSQSRHFLLVHEPFLRPMLKLMESCQRDVLPIDIEKRLVALLYQLCVLLMQNIDLVDLFFTRDQSKFIIFVLLIHFVHRDDSVGMQARDALLLCMSLTKKKKNIGDFISQQSNICIILASGLSGLYSVLPHVLSDITVPDWHRLTPDDVKDIKDLSMFVTSLEFSNAVAQVAHPNIAKHLQEFMYKGFLVPVLGPALLQSSVGEQLTATAYLELILRTVTHPGLLYPLLQFLFFEYDKQRLLHILISRIDSEPRLTLVSLALFDSLVDINCEDVMLELVFQYLQPCLHLMLSQRRLLLPLDPQCQNFECLLALAPSCCDQPASPRLDGRQVHWNHYGGQQSLYGNYHAYLCDARNKINVCQLACTQWSNSYTGCEIDDNRQLICTDENVNSMPSLSESSGYASLKLKIDNASEETYLPIWQISQAGMNSKTVCNKNTTMTEDDETLNSSGTAGPFLTILLEKLKHMLNNTFYINLHLTGLISRLAVYPQPLLRTYLLDHSLVLQPNLPSLFQIIGSLKQTIDEYMFRQSDRIVLIQQAKFFLLDRETRLVNARKNAIDRSSLSSITSVSTIDNNQPFQRNGPKRRSLTLSSISNMFGRRPSQMETPIPMITPPDDNDNLIYPKFNEAQHVAICAVLLDEWVKELAALAQEHTISQFAALFK